MLRPIRFFPRHTSFDFVRWRYIAFAFTGALLVATLISLAVQGFNLGIDFAGGILMEVRAPQAVDMADVRSRLEQTGIPGIQLQQFGEATDLLIRVQRQEGGEEAQQAAIEAVRGALGTGYDYRRVELVGPAVGSELLHGGIIATLLALGGIALYVAFRFQWQFGVAALIATFHDVLVTAGLYSVLRLDFDMTSIAALLTLAGYSINDTVVVFDRIREVMRRRRTASLTSIINESVNTTLSRTVMTSATTMLAVLALLFFGGSTLFNFSLALAWGIAIGTYSSIFVAACLLLYLPSPSRSVAAASAAPGTTLTPAARKE